MSGSQGQSTAIPLQQAQISDRESGDTSYSTALYNAKKIGGKKFHNKQYGGGIVFQSYNIQDTERHILEMVKGE